MGAIDRQEEIFSMAKMAVRKQAKDIADKRMEDVERSGKLLEEIMKVNPKNLTKYTADTGVYKQEMSSNPSAPVLYRG